MREVAILPLKIVQKVVLGISSLGAGRLVFHDPIQKRARRSHTRLATMSQVERVRNQSKRLGISFEPVNVLEEAVQGAFAAMSEWRVSQIMTEAAGFNQIRIDMEIVSQKVRFAPQEIANRPSNLRHFNRVGQTGTIEIILARQVYLRLGLQLAKSRRVDDPISIDLKRGSIVYGTRRRIPKGFPIVLTVKSVLRHC